MSIDKIRSDVATEASYMAANTPNGLTDQIRPVPKANPSDRPSNAPTAEKTTPSSGWEFARFKDSKLEAYLKSAEAYFIRGDLELAEAILDNIIGFNLSAATARPLFYDEAVFLKSTVLVAKGLRSNNKEFFQQALTLLKDNFENLMSAEIGYKRKYCLEMLKLATQYRQQFYEDLPGITKETIRGYFEDATKTYNNISSGGDIFIALRSFVTYGDYLSLNEDFTSASEMYNTAIALTRYFTMEEAEDPNQRKKDEEIIDRHIHSLVDLRRLFNSTIGPCIRSIPLSDRLPIISGLLENSKPFQGKYLSFYMIRALSGLGKIQKEKWSSAVNIDELKSAIDYFEKSEKLFESVNEDKQVVMDPGLWEERQFYFMVLSELSELYTLNGELDKSAEKALIVARYFNNGSVMPESLPDVKVNGDNLNPWDALFEKGYIDGNGVISEKLLSISEPSDLDLGINISDTDKRKVLEAVIESSTATRREDLIKASYNKVFSILEHLSSKNPSILPSMLMEDCRSSWALLDSALNPFYGSVISIWMSDSSKANYKIGVDTLLKALSMVSAEQKDNTINDVDVHQIESRAYTWLGNLMKWADDGKTDAATEQQIIELAKGLAKTEEDKAVAGTREGAIIVLYKAALEQFAQIANKPLYLKAEEESTKYHLSDMAGRILEDKDSSQELRTAAEKVLESYPIAASMTGLQGIIDSAEEAKQPDIAANALTSYADSRVRGISDLLANGEPEKAYDEANKQFTVRTEAGEKVSGPSPELLEFCKGSGCKYYYDAAKGTLVARGKMTDEDKAALEKILTSEADRKAIAALFESSQHSLSVETLGRPIQNNEGSVPAMLTIANALISKPFAENDDNGPITRITVSEIADLAEAQILGKHPDLAAAPKEVKAQLADIAALRLYVLMGDTPAGEPIPDDKIASYIKLAKKEDGSTAIVVPLKTDKEIEVTDVFMQQKLKLALISIWMRNNAWTEETLKLAKEWTADINKNGLNYTFRKYAIQNGGSLVGIELKGIR